MTGPSDIAVHWDGEHGIHAAFVSEGVTITLAQALALVPKIAAALAAPPEPHPSPAVVDLATARIVNAPDVRGWPETTTITRLWFDGAVTRVTFTKQDGSDRWPDVTPPGWQGPLQFTLWLFRHIAGQWVGSAFIQFWHGRDGSGSPGDPDVPSRYHEHWFYGSRWNPLQVPGPIQPGEPLAFMVTSGNARDAVGPYGPEERSNAIIVPATDVGSYTF